MIVRVWHGWTTSEESMPASSYWPCPSCRASSPKRVHGLAGVDILRRIDGHDPTSSSSR